MYSLATGPEPDTVDQEVQGSFLGKTSGTATGRHHTRAYSALWWLMLELQLNRSIKKRLWFMDSWLPPDAVLYSLPYLTSTLTQEGGAAAVTVR